MPLTRVAVLGLGWAARSIWLGRLQAHPGYFMTAAVDPDPGARERARAHGTVERVLASADELDQDRVDLVVVAAPNHLHCPLACSMLERGISVFVEKPVCLSIAEADRLAAAERAGGAVLLAGSAARYRSDVRALYGVLDEVGPVRHVETSWARARGIPAADGWFTHRRLSGGGALVDLGWHLLDVIGPVLGPVAFDQVVGTTTADFIAGATAAAWRGDADAGPGPGSGPGAGRRDVEDTARGFLVTSDGVSVGLRVGWMSHEPYDVTSVRVEGARGAATLRCTFGFSPDRVDRSSLALTREGRTTAIPVAAAPIGAEYDRQLDVVREQLADPTAVRGRAITEARSIVGLIARLYDSAAAARGRRTVAVTH